MKKLKYLIQYQTVNTEDKWLEWSITANNKPAALEAFMRHARKHKITPKNLKASLYL